MEYHKFGKTSKRNLYGDDTKQGVAPIVAELCELALYYSTVDFSIIDGRRTKEEQRTMYDKGNSSLDGVNKISDHQIGMAIDVLPIVKVDGVKLNAFDITIDAVKLAWLEVYRAFMRAAMKLGLILEFGLGYNISGGRDWPHISIKGKVPKDYSGLSLSLI